MSKVIMNYPSTCAPCGKPLPPEEQMRDGEVTWWQMPTDNPDVTEMVYYHRGCGAKLLEERGWDVCWAGCQRVIFADQEKVWTDPDGDGHFMWLHARCAGERAVELMGLGEDLEQMR